MAGASVRLDGGSVIPALQAWQRAGGNLRPFFLEAGEEIALSTRARFSSQIGPDGRPWAQLSQAYADSERKQRSRGAGKIGTLDGFLGGQIVYQASDSDVRIGSNRIYAAAFQFGYEPRNQPAREFLGLDDADRQTLLDLVADLYERAAG
jgi:phage virion morphogenesis protein